MRGGGNRGVAAMGLEESSGGRVREEDRRSKREAKDPLVDKSCMRVHPERPRSYSWNIQPDDCSKDAPANLKFPQRPLCNNVTTAVYRTALRASLFIVQFPSRDFRDGTVSLLWISVPEHSVYIDIMRNNDY